MNYLKLAIGVLAAAIALWSYDRRSWFVEEHQRNKNCDAPSNGETKWHIQHIREDLGTIVFALRGILLLVFFLVVLEII